MMLKLTTTNMRYSGGVSARVCKCPRNVSPESVSTIFT